MLAKNPVEEEIQGALDSFAEGCQVELTTYCKDVQPVEARILACLYAFSGKFSQRCEYSLYNSMMDLNRTVTNLSYAIDEC